MLFVLAIALCTSAIQGNQKFEVTFYVTNLTDACNTIATRLLGTCSETSTTYCTNTQETALHVLKNSDDWKRNNYC